MDSTVYKNANTTAQQKRKYTWHYQWQPAPEAQEGVCFPQHLVYHPPHIPIRSTRPVVHKVALVHNGHVTGDP